MKRIVILIAAAMLGGVAVPAQADILPGDIDRFIVKFDRNKDGMLTRVEVMEMVQKTIDKMASKDGMVDSKRLAELLAELSKSDGGAGRMVSKEDAMKMVEAAFKKADAGKKGMLERAQAEAFLRELMRSN